MAVSDRRTAVGTPPLQKAERRSDLQSAALKGGSTTAGPPASAKKPLNQVQVFALLVNERSTDFDLE